MDNIETEMPIEKPKKKKQRKARKTPRRASFHKPATLSEKSATFPGLTENECPKACSASQCVISGSIICGHPRKGGLQAGDTPALIRRQQAEKQLGIDKMEKRYT